MFKKLCMICCILVVFLLSSSFIPKGGSYSSNMENNKIIYLTFDDGPSTLTDKFLDVLSENQIKGTFFLIGDSISAHSDTVKRIYDEGHSIGLHTCSHEYKIIYKNHYNFLKEMKQCQDEIYKVTGTRPNLIRFPGGSSKHLTKAYVDEIHGKGYRIFDWNAYMSDGINYKIPPDSLYKEATSSTVRFYPIILLMHCDSVNKNTLQALPSVIKYYRDKGFEFRAITNDTPEYYFPVKKQ